MSHLEESILLTDDGAPEVPKPSHFARAGQPPIISQRWRPVPILRVEDARVINLQTFQEEETVHQSGVFLGRQTRNKLGMLERADLQITVTLPRAIRQRNLSAKVDLDAAGFTSRHTDVVVGETFIDQSVRPEENSLQLLEEEMRQEEAAAASSDNVPTDRLTVIVPVARGLSTKMPVWDELNYQGEHVIHQTLRIPGCPCAEKADQASVTWYIRLKIREALGTVEVMSIGTSCFDARRWDEHLTTFKSACYDAKVKVMSWLPQSCTRTRQQAANQQQQQQQQQRAGGSGYVSVPQEQPPLEHLPFNPVAVPRQPAPVSGMSVGGLPVRPIYVSLAPGQDQNQPVIYAIPAEYLSANPQQFGIMASPAAVIDRVVSPPPKSPSPVEQQQQQPQPVFKLEE